MAGSARPRQPTISPGRDSDTSPPGRASPGASPAPDRASPAVDRASPRLKRGRSQQPPSSAPAKGPSHNGPAPKAESHGEEFETSVSQPFGSAHAPLGGSDQTKGFQALTGTLGKRADVEHDSYRYTSVSPHLGAPAASGDAPDLNRMVDHLAGHLQSSEEGDDTEGEEDTEEEEVGSDGKHSHTDI